MKPISPELLTLLTTTRQFFAVDIYTFSGGNLGNTVLRYCAGDDDITVNGILYPAGKQTGPYFDRKDNKAKVHWKVGTEVDTMTFDVIPGSAQVFGVQFQTAVRYGIFDGVEMLLERVFMPTYGDTRYGTVRMFYGRMASIDAGRSLCTFSISSHLELLNVNMPRNLYQATCVNNLGDKACGVVISSYMSTGLVQNGSTSALLLATINGGPYLTGYFDQGKVTFTSGPLSGLSATIKVCTFASPNTIQLLGYLPMIPPGVGSLAFPAGSAFNIYAGCDKTLDSNGCPKFSNTARYRAERLVPQPSTAQ